MALNPLDPSQQAISLDDLLKANKDQFDQIIANQQQALGVLHRAQRPPGEQAKAETKPEVELEAPSPAADTAKSADSAANTAGTKLVPVLDVEARSASARPATRTDNQLNTITLDRIEIALSSICQEMASVLDAAPNSSSLQEHHGEQPIITDAKGRMLSGQFSSNIAEMLKQKTFADDYSPGDIILQSDPYLCNGAVSHLNDWIVTMPIFIDETLIGFSAMFGHMRDVGSANAGSMPITAQSIFAEGLRIPPIKIYRQGTLNQAALDIILNNTRTPEQNQDDLMTLITVCQIGAQRVAELCQRFGRALYMSACDALLKRCRNAMRNLIVQYLPAEPKTFEDYVDGDGCGNGPFKLKLALWRENEQAYFDWAGTSTQAQGPINCYLHKDLFKSFIGIYLNYLSNARMALNAGFYELIHVNMPTASLLQPDFPAALGNRSATLARQFDVLTATLNKNTPNRGNAAGYGANPQFYYSGVTRDGRPFQLTDTLAGGLPGQSSHDGLDGHSCWPLQRNTPIETLEKKHPVVVEQYRTVIDSGGAGQYRGGNAIEKVYLLLEPGEIALRDDRQHSQPWGIAGGKPGASSEKYLIRENGARESLPSKIDHVKVKRGDRIIFRTAAGGGWGNPLERDQRQVRNDVARGLISVEAARDDYGVVISKTITTEIDTLATRDLRHRSTRHRLSNS